MGQKTAEETFIAIDFGTRASRIAHAGSETKPLIGDLAGEIEIPAALTLSKEGGMLAGLEAHAHAVLFPAETVLSLRALFTQGSQELIERGPFFPHALGDSQLLQVEAGGRRRLPMELAALYLLHLRRTAELALERPVESVVLTVPVVFTPLDRQAYRLSARMAGFRRVRLIDESTAAALAALAAGVQGRVAVCSWGAGYLSLALVELRRDIVKVLAAAGSSQAGGERVELALARDFLARVREAGLSFENETHVARHILTAAAKALPEIATRGEAEVQVRLAEQRQPFRQVYRRDDIQNWLEPLKETATALGKRMAGDLHLLPGDVDALVLAGGMTRFDSVRKHLEGFYRRAAVDSIDPLEAAVRGALVRAQFLNRETPQPLVLDNLPWSVGIEGQQGRVDVLLNRQERIPSSKLELFTTFLEKQTEVGIQLCSHTGQKWEPFASVALSKIPAMKGSQPQIEVTFAFDADATLEIGAREVTKSRPLEVELRPSRGLTAGQLKSVLQELPPPSGEPFLDTMREELRSRGRLLIAGLGSAMSGHSGVMTRDEKQLIMAKSKELEEVLEGVDLGEMRTCSRELAEAAQPLVHRLHDKSLEALLR